MARGTDPAFCRRTTTISQRWFFLRKSENRKGLARLVFLVCLSLSEALKFKLKEKTAVYNNKISLLVLASQAATVRT